jgi:uncharacterized protein
VIRAHPASLDDSAVAAQLAELAEYRELRETLETAILPLATSVDGRSFVFQASLHGLELETGGYVALDTRGGSALGQVRALAMEQQETGALDRPGRILIRIARGTGALLDAGERPFHDAAIRPASVAEVAEWIERNRPSAELDVGELALAPGVPFALDAAGLGRHTFLCGQSGSGKTYSLGVLLEQVLMATGMRVVVLDPNSDYVRLGDVRAQTDPSAAERYRAAAGQIGIRSGTAGDSRIGIRFRELSPAHQAAALRLDPVVDREEYAELTALVEDDGVRSLEDLARSPAEALKMRMRNLGVHRWGIWPGPEGASLVEELDSPDAPRCLVVDIGSLGTREEQALAAGAVLEALWRRRHRREPVAIVIDEAHNVCPAEPADAVTALATQDAVRIAGEGRKFGLHLIVVTQRPQKVHENVLSQCDNLVLMRMNSAADLGHVARSFSFAPPQLVDRAATFAQGEALVAGRLASHPALIRFGARLTEEGGADVAGWA